MRKIRKIEHIDLFYDIVHVSVGNTWMIALLFYLLFKNTNTISLEYFSRQ